MPRRVARFSSPYYDNQAQTALKWTVLERKYEGGRIVKTYAHRFREEEQAKGFKKNPRPML